MNNFDQFNALHHQTEPLLIANVWNAQSARTFEKLKSQALATSSAAVAETLGYSDGEEMTFDEYLYVVKRIKASTTVPLSVDLESGYGKTPDEIVLNIKRLVEVGVSGINIEDSSIQNGTRKIEDSKVFSDRLEAISTSLKSENINIFINVRCDAFLLALPDTRVEAIKRLREYQEAGVQGLFLPCITSIDDIKAVVKEVRLPLNVMCMPDLPHFEMLKSAGIKRISMGNFLNKALNDSLELSLKKIMEDRSFKSLFS
jgi:2-methylisocitrate lyase-like PEP mutase family enzyme